MEEEALQIRYLVVIAAVLCAMIIGYNLFFTPEVKITAVYVDSSSVSDSGGVPVNTGIVEPESRIELSEVPTPAGASFAGKININEATAEELDSLPGIGPVLAGRILEYREKNGRFQSLDQLKNVSGIGESTFEKLKDFITLE